MRGARQRIDGAIEPHVEYVEDVDRPARDVPLLARIGSVRLSECQDDRSSSWIGDGRRNQAVFSEWGLRPCDVDSTRAGKFKSPIIVVEVGQRAPNGAVQLLDPQRVFGGGLGELTIVFLEFGNPLEVKSVLSLQTRVVVRCNFGS